MLENVPGQMYYSRMSPTDARYHAIAFARQFSGSRFELPPPAHMPV